MTQLNDELKRLIDDFVFHKYEWDIFKTLFAKSPARTKLLNKTAPKFFSNLQWILFDRTVINLSKITDPSKIGKYENLSLTLLVERVVVNDYPNVSQIINCNNLILERVSKIRKLRSKKVVHRDKETALNKVKLKSLGGISIEEIDEIFELISNLLNEIYKNLENSTYLFDLTGSDKGDQLIEFLKIGYHFNRELNKDWKLRMDIESIMEFKDA